MKANLSIILTSFIISVLASTCTKLGVQWPHDHHNPPQEGNICRITKITQDLEYLSGVRTGNFYYSNNGNLDSIVFDVQGLVHYWKYDSQNRLIEYRDTYNHDLTQFITLHRYASDGNRIVRDTTWLAGASGYIIQLWTLEYDNKGRVIRETGVRLDNEAKGAILPPRNYVYDQRGNLVNDTYHFEYDDNVNYLRTSKVLQFIHRNYSMNNEAYFVFGYNSYGLPLVHRLWLMGQFLGLGHPTELNYSCLPIPGGGAFKDGCRFANMKQLIAHNNYRFGTFYYTPDGRPLSVLFQDPPRTQTASHHFVYDKHNRLINYYSAYNIAWDYYHSYGYANGRITIDTLYASAEDERMQISQLAYDNLGRIVKEDIHVIQRFGNPVSEHSTVNYNYDGNGNLISPLVTAYDNKVNFLRTNPIWMFIHRNYSRNNPQGVTGYTGRGLPLGFSNKVFGFLGWAEPAELSYVCREENKYTK